VTLLLAVIALLAFGYGVVHFFDCIVYDLIMLNADNDYVAQSPILNCILCFACLAGYYSCAFRIVNSISI
jgi:hypothetical protein